MKKTPVITGGRLKIGLRLALLYGRKKKLKSPILKNNGFNKGRGRWRISFENTL